MDESLIQNIYKYIDQKGIPIRILRVVGISISNDNPYNEVYLEKGITIKKSSGGRKIIFNLPFDLDPKGQETIVLKYFEDTTGYKFENPHSLIDFPNIDGSPFILLLNEHDSDRMKISLGKKVIPGSFITRPKYHNYGIKTLGNIEHIKGDFGVMSELQNLGNLKRVDGNLWLSDQGNHSIKTLTPLKYVGGDLIIRSSSTSLGVLETVKGKLNLRRSQVEDLGNLKFVGGDFLYSKRNEQYYDFSKIQIVGKIKGFNDKF